MGIGEMGQIIGETGVGESSKFFVHGIAKTRTHNYGFCKATSGQRVVVVSRDTDALVLLHFKHQLPWDSTLRAFHAVTGCETVSQFAGHGKVTAWKAFKHNRQLLTSLGCGELQKKHAAALRSVSAKYMNH